MWEARYGRSFKRNLLLFLLPLLVPLSGLGFFSQFITKQYIEEELTKNNLNLLNQAKENLELIFVELDALNLNFRTNVEITAQLQKVLNRLVPVISYEEGKILKTMNNFIAASANSRPYIHSIYIYLKNPLHRFLTDTNGLVNLENYHDTGWYQSYQKYGSSRDFWTERRPSNYYQRDAGEIITIYQRLYYRHYHEDNGVIVLNIYADYLRERLNDLIFTPGQKILIVNNYQELIFANEPIRDLQALLSRVDNTRPVAELDLTDGRYVVSQLVSEKYGWRYISLAPFDKYYHIPIKLRKTTLILVIITFSLGLALTYWVTKKNDIQLQNMVSIIKSAEKGEVVAEPVANIKDEYGYITYNLLKTFIEQKYLKVQLSERKYKLKYMEQLALQSQINPHFLFNTLETIKWKVIEFTQKPNQASQMVMELSDILKYSLDAPDKQVRLSEEILNTRNYIEIQKMRYVDKFDVIWEYDDAVLNLSIIRLVLQPIIENAIYHGIKPLDKPCLIKIKIYQIQNQLKITVINNGLGIPKEDLERLRQKLAADGEYTRHIGLVNTNKRLKLSYGEQYGLKIRSKMNLGTVVYLRIPAIIF